MIFLSLFFYYTVTSVSLTSTDCVYLAEAQSPGHLQDRGSAASATARRKHSSALTRWQIGRGGPSSFLAAAGESQAVQLHRAAARLSWHSRRQEDWL